MTHRSGPSAPWVWPSLSCLVFLYAFLLAVQSVYNYDIWWHLRTGEWILETGRIPRTDPFSFTTPMAPWQPHYWLSDVLLALGLRLGGLDLLILAKALIVATAFLIVFRLLRRQAVNPILAAALVLVAAPMAQFRFLLRPHVVMFLLAATFLWMLSVWGRERDRRLWWLVPLTLLWVNLHGSFFLGPVLVGGLLAEALVARDRAGVRVLLPLLLLVGAATLVNPFGLDLLRRVIEDFSLKNVLRSVDVEEHRALAWGEHRAFWGLMLATATSFLLAFRRARPFHVVVFAAASVLAIGGVRFVALAALLQAPILGYNLQRALDRLPWSRWPSPRLQAVVAVPLLLLAGVLLFQQAYADAKVYRFGLGVNESRFPGAAVRFLNRIAPSGNLYNSWRFGGYLLWHDPQRKIFWDGRSLDAQNELAARVAAMSVEEIGTLLDAFDVRAAIVSPTDRRISAAIGRAGRLRLAYFDDQARVFLAPDALAAGERPRVRFLELIDPDAYDVAHLVAYARSAMAPMAEAELRHAVSLAPHSATAQVLLGVFFEAAGRRPEALEAYLAAARANPRLALVHYDVGRRGGRLAVQLGSWEQATWLLREAIRFGKSGELLFLLGTALYQTGDAAGAERAYREMLRREPRQVAGLVNLGYLYLDTGRFEQAEAMQRRALEAAPGHEQALFGLALTLQKAGKSADAEQQWRRFLETHPGSPWAAKARAYLEELGLAGSRR